MKDLLEQIKKRRSCRSFTDQLVEKEKIDRIIEAGLNAPSARNNQEGLIIAIQDKKILNRLREINREVGGFPQTIDSFYGANTVLLVIYKKIPTAELDGGAMMENMLIEAESLGLGACWIHRAKEEIELEEVRELLKDTHINFEEYVGIGHIILGYKKTNEVKEKTIKDNRKYYLL